MNDKKQQIVWLNEFNFFKIKIWQLNQVYN